MAVRDITGGVLVLPGGKPEHVEVRRVPVDGAGHFIADFAMAQWPKR